jgi:hypothetical protein
MTWETHPVTPNRFEDFTDVTNRTAGPVGRDMRVDLAENAKVRGAREARGHTHAVTLSACAARPRSSSRRGRAGRSGVSRTVNHSLDEVWDLLTSPRALAPRRFAGQIPCQ